jgi:hypothetical protein
LVDARPRRRLAGIGPAPASAAGAAVDAEIGVAAAAPAAASGVAAVLTPPEPTPESCCASTHDSDGAAGRGVSAWSRIAPMSAG